MNRPMLVVYAAAALAVALIGARYIKASAAGQGAGYSASGSSEWNATSRGGGSASSANTGVGSGASSSTGAQDRKFSALVVHVAGAVKHPGLVRLRDGDRAGDAVAAAGGPSNHADLNAINLAMRLADGQQVIVPARNGAALVGGTGATGPVSLSSATAAQLDELEGVGPGLAQKIIDYRTQHGGFRSVDELAEVPGIGEKRLESLRGQLQP